MATKTKKKEEQLTIGASTKPEAPPASTEPAAPPASTEPAASADDGPVAENEEIATRPPAAVDRYHEPPMGYDGFTEDDLIIPRYSIVQKSSDSVDKGYHVGSFVSNISDEEVESMRCTAILYRKGMVHFIKPYQKGQKPDCRSNDALKPSPQCEKPFSQVCHKIVRRRLVPICPEAAWTKDKTGKSVPPACNLCFNVILRSEDTGNPFFISFRSSALRSIRAFISNLWSMRKNLFSVSFLLSTESASNQYGTFYVPKLSDIETHAEEDTPTLVEIYKGMQMMNLDESFDDERNLADDGEEIDAGDASFNPSELENEKF